MDAITENGIRQDQIESFGRLMAGFSHDMKNHLGIIRESNGLLGDLIAMSGLDENEVLVQRLEKAVSSIEKRVVIAADMLHHLSSFAHRSDSPCASFNVNSLITEACIFLERFARLKQVNFSLEPGEGLASIYNDPSLLHHVFYRIYSFCLEQLSAGRAFTVITRQNQGVAEIVFRIGCQVTEDEQLFDDSLQAAVKKLHGKLEKTVALEDYSDIVLSVPSIAGE